MKNRMTMIFPPVSLTKIALCVYVGEREREREEREVALSCFALSLSL